jgi:haloacetate dehalogenase
MGSEDCADFLRAVHAPAVVRAMLEDYRAGLAVDRAHDDADRAAGSRLVCPTLVTWSTRDDMEQLYGNPMDVWRPWATDLRGQAIDSGHHVAEENPDDLVAALLTHFTPLQQTCH